MSEIVTSKKSKIFFENLDGLRTIAFLLVFVSHSFKEWSSNRNFYTNLPLRFLHMTLSSGGLGVSIFFALSGFLITYLLVQEDAVKGKINISFFYLRRILRIWPLYYVLLFLTFAIYPLLINYYGYNALQSRPAYYLLFLSNFDVIHLASISENMWYSVQTITWSVAIEEQFYIVWPILFIITPRKYYTFIFVVVILTSLLFRLNNLDSRVLYYHSLSVCGDLATGGLAGYYAYQSEKFRNFFRILDQKIIVGVYIFMVGWLFYSSQFHHTETAGAFHRVLNTIFFAFVILEQNYSLYSFFKFSSFKLLSKLGKYTYGLYLLHPISLGGVYLILSYWSSEFNLQSTSTTIVYSILSLLITIFLSYISYQYFEKTFLKFKDKFNLIKTKPTDKLALAQIITENKV